MLGNHKLALPHAPNLASNPPRPLPQLRHMRGPEMPVTDEYLANNAMYAVAAGDAFVALRRLIFAANRLE